MPAVAGPPVSAPGMGDQPAAQAIIDLLLRKQAQKPARSVFGRVFGCSPLAAESVSWYLGAKGELDVAAMLATLPASWSVFHSLPIGKKGADIDHLVIGPGGIFTINTKNHTGKGIWVAGQTLMVSGCKVPYLRSAEYEADRVTTLLGERMPNLAAAHPVVAIVNAKSLSITKKPEKVAVVTGPALRRWLMTRPVVLGPAELAGLRAVIDNPGTWPAPLFSATPNAQELFATLDAEVRTALLRRTIWKLTGIAALVAGLLLVAPALSAAMIGLATAG